MSAETILVGFAMLYLVAFIAALVWAFLLNDDLKEEKMKHWITRSKLEEAIAALRQEKARATAVGNPTSREGEAQASEGTQP